MSLTHQLWRERTKHSQGWNNVIRTGTWGLAGTPGAPAKDGGQAANMKSFDLSVSKAVSTIYENPKINLDIKPNEK